MSNSKVIALTNQKGGVGKTTGEYTYTSCRVEFDTTRIETYTTDGRCKMHIVFRSEVMYNGTGKKYYQTLV